MWKTPSGGMPAQRNFENGDSAFLEDLQRFLISNGYNITHLNPRLNGQSIKLSELYEYVVNRGGFNKVNLQNAWEDIVRLFGVDKPCTNATYAIRSVYQQFLYKYECSKFNRTVLMDDFAEEDDSAFRRATVSSYGSSKIPENYRSSVGLPDLKAENAHEKLTLSLCSGLPNEIDFALNALLILSADSRRNLILNKGNQMIFDALMQTVGLSEYKIPSNSVGLLNKVREVYDKFDSVRFRQFWKATTTLSHLLPSFISSDASSNDQFFDSKIEQFESEELRVKQVAVILYNLTFDDSTAAFLATQESCWRFCFMSTSSSRPTLAQLGLELLNQLANKLENAKRFDWLPPALIETIKDALKSPDRARLLQGLYLLPRLCDLDVKVSQIYVDALVQEDYLRLLQYLSVPDAAIVINALEAMYKLTELGEKQCHALADLSDLIPLLVNLIKSPMGIATHIDETLTAPVVTNTAAPILPLPAPVLSAPVAAPQPPPQISSVAAPSSEETEVVTGWIRRTFDVEETFALTITDIFRDYLVFCASTRKFTAQPQTLMHCLKIAFPNAKTANLKVGDKLQLCLLGYKKRDASSTTILNGQISSEAALNDSSLESAAKSNLNSQDRPIDSLAQPVLNGSSATPSKAVLKSGLLNGENSSLIRSLLASKINNKHNSSDSLVSPNNGPLVNGVADHHETSPAPMTTKPQKPPLISRLSSSDVLNGCAEDSNMSDSSISRSSLSNSNLPVPYVNDETAVKKTPKPRGRPRLNGTAKKATKKRNSTDIAAVEIAPLNGSRIDSDSANCESNADKLIADQVDGNINGKSATKRRKSSNKDNESKLIEAAAPLPTNEGVVGSNTVTNLPVPVAVPAQPQPVPVVAPSLVPGQPNTGNPELLDFLCEWDSCNRSFTEVGAVFRHCVVDHVPTSQDGVCRWSGCSGIKRNPLSLITHLTESHCAQHDLIKHSLRRRDARRAGIPVPQPQPATNTPQTVPNFQNSEHAALHSIHARYAGIVALDFATEPENANTKCIRLTAALVLRNIARFSHFGRIRIMVHEGVLVSCGMQSTDAAHIINQCLSFLHADHSRER